MTVQTEGKVELFQLTEESQKKSNQIERTSFKQPGINEMQQIIFPYNNTVRVRQRVQSKNERKSPRDPFIAVLNKGQPDEQGLTKLKDPEQETKDAELAIRYVLDKG